jgi:hypothetical protein
MIYRRDFLQHVGWGDQSVSVGAFRIHVQLLFVKRSRRLRFSRTCFRYPVTTGFQRISDMKMPKTGKIQT